jgi:DNA polymerase-3 subunit delta
MMDGLRGEGVAPPLVLWALADEIRTIARVLEGAAAGKRPPQLWFDAKVYGDPHRQAMQQNMRRFAMEQVEAAIVHAARVDRMIKGLIRGDVWDELLQLALRFAAGAPARPPKQGRMAAPARAAAENQTGLF